MATAPAIDGNYTSYSQPQVHENQNETYQPDQQNSNSTPLELNYPTKVFDPARYDPKSRSQHQLRWRLAQIAQSQ